MVSQNIKTALSVYALTRNSSLFHFNPTMIYSSICSSISLICNTSMKAVPFEILNKMIYNIIYLSIYLSIYIYVCVCVCVCVCVYSFHNSIGLAFSH